jgi:Ribosomal protein L36e
MRNSHCRKRTFVSNVTFVSWDVVLQMCKRKLGTHIRGKKKREELSGVLRKMQAAAKAHD